MQTPPSDQIQTFLNLWTYWRGKTPTKDILKGLLFSYICIENEKLIDFFSFLGWYLRVIYNADIFEKSEFFLNFFVFYSSINLTILKYVT